MQNLLHAFGDIVVLLANDRRRQNTACRIERIYSRINTLGSDIAGQNRSRVQMRKSRRGRRVCQVIGRNINCLYRSDGSLLGRCDPFLQRAHFCRECRLIADGGRHTSKQCRNFRTCLCKAENIINEQKHVLILDIAEILCHCQSGKSDSHSGSRRLIHLTIDQNGFVENPGFLHFAVQIITLTGTFSDARKNRNTVMIIRDVIDQLFDQDCFADAGATEQTDLAALGIRADQVNDLDAGFKNFRRRHLLLKGRRGAVDAPVLRGIGCGLIVNRISQQVKHTADAAFADRNRNRASEINGLCPADKAVR